MARLNRIHAVKALVAVLCMTLFPSLVKAQDLAAVIAEAKPTIDKANSDWLPAIQHEDAKALAEPYADKGIFVTTAGQSIVGKQAIEQMYRDRFGKAQIVDGKIIEDGIVAEGALIYEWGHADITAKSNGATSMHTGYYLTVWQRSPSGTWQIIRNLTF